MWNLSYTRRSHWAGQNRTSALHRCRFDEERAMPDWKSAIRRRQHPAWGGNVQVPAAEFECPAHGGPM
jgi:hypothetical protein